MASTHSWWSKSTVTYQKHKSVNTPLTDTTTRFVVLPALKAKFYCCKEKLAASKLVDFRYCRFQCNYRIEVSNKQSLLLRARHLLFRIAFRIVIFRQTGLWRMKLRKDYSVSKIPSKKRFRFLVSLSLNPFPCKNNIYYSKKRLPTSNCYQNRVQASAN